MNETKKKRVKTFLSQGVAGGGIGFPRVWEGGKEGGKLLMLFSFFFL